MQALHGNRAGVKWFSSTASTSLRSQRLHRDAGHETSPHPKDQIGSYLPDLGCYQNQGEHEPLSDRLNAFREWAESQDVDYGPGTISFTPAPIKGRRKEGLRDPSSSFSPSLLLPYQPCLCHLRDYLSSILCPTLRRERRLQIALDWGRRRVTNKKDKPTLSKMELRSLPIALRHPYCHLNRYLR